ncbi:hypothetical protein [Halioxenophilus aromaticivorans]|uniref:Uncharacterized protein n=1 Tax=Halioxenophilus aromaticivorans TaxID=1306992 RepID=A0AAV3U3H1_9ALTE
MMGTGEGDCPFQFNFEPETFKVGDTISYRAPALGELPFVAEIKAVHSDYIEIANRNSQPRRPGKMAARHPGKPA